MSKLSTQHIVDIKLITGKKIKIRKGKIVGYCHNIIHKGALTSQLLKEHKCIEKECTYFKKCTKAGFWEAQERTRKMKEKSKERKKQTKLKKQENDEIINEIKSCAEKIVIETSYNIMVTSVVKRAKEKYTIFYVSDKQENEKQMCKFLSDEMFFRIGELCYFKHIKDGNGRFVTINEYLSRPK